jgi:calcineurin-like phosphoesterase family protein
MSQFWFIADTHFDVYDSSRPFSSAGSMNQTLINNWNRLVRPDDVVFHLGDVGWYNRFPNWAVPLLHGKKILILGNHDNLHPRIYKEYFDDVQSGPVILTVANTDGENLELSLSHTPDEGHTNLYRLHGDVHNMWKARPGMLNVGVDVWDYRPVSLEEVVIHMNRDTIFGREAQEKR